MNASPEHGPFRLADRPAHLGTGATAIPQPPFVPDMAWYEAYGVRHASDGREGRLLSMHTFAAPWTMWEMHPEGAEVVLVTEGRCMLIQECDGEVTRIELAAGDYAINPPGVWHTADAEGSVTAVFITAGIGTQHRPR
ncbi:MAG: cupin domain-containing protein [Planctomycetota bacterium]